MSYLSTKTYGHERGLSVAFRQWRAKHSHCSLIHGYALSVKLIFHADTLDALNWVVDFGGLKEVEKWLKRNYDHILLVEDSDPQRDLILKLHAAGAASCRLTARVGCESFAEHIFHHVALWTAENYPDSRASLVSVEVAEHGANSATYIGRY
jgi:6-pyruvoyltetrahydropterin/6-carboxytetrahydropterin synthase